jgi:hypothetical protein
MPALAIRILAIIVAVASLHAQDDTPDFVELATARDAALADLRAARKTRLADCRTTYLQLLDAALKTAAAPAAAIIARERDGIARGLVAPAEASGLGDDLASARRVFFNGVGKASVEFDAAKKKLDTDYLKALAKLQAKSKRDKALAAHIAAEKRRIASGD